MSPEKLLIMTQSNHSEAILTLDWLKKVKAFAENIPKPKPMVGMIMHSDVLFALRQQMEKDAKTMVVDGKCHIEFPYLMGAPVYECLDISPEHTEVYYDKEFFQARLKQLKLIS